MAGLYLHIPFCAKRCIYCDFYSNTDMKLKERYVDLLIREMALRKAYIGNEPLKTIYFGGGTPSLLSVSEFERLFSAIAAVFDVSDCREITLEANPDDFTVEYVQSLRELPFNRVSMGVQSFRQKDLDFLNRRHTVDQAVDAVKISREQGLTNISIDLMYGLPGQTLQDWEENLQRVIALKVPHVSAYHLTYEEGTRLDQLLKGGKITAVDEETSHAMYEMLVDQLTQSGYLHYEISNFAHPGYVSQHNSSYWLGESYLGLGPSAHSYNRETRQSNVSSLSHYMEGIACDRPLIEEEKLDLNTRFNDYIVTRLRTMWGINIDEIRTIFGNELGNYAMVLSEENVKKGFMTREEKGYRLTNEGFFISDGIICDFLRI